MSKVYFKSVTSKQFSEYGAAARLLLERLVADTGHQFEATVPIKVHFGEKGNETYVPSDCYLEIIDYLKSNSVESAYIETNVLYRGSRTTADSHKAIALEHGFTQLPIIIADGEYGEAYIEVPIHKEFIDSCKIGAAFGDYNQVLVMSHFKGHGSAGFGGALKQLAMGFGSRGGKLAQHSGISPFVTANKCVACGACLTKCDVNAITMPDKAVIDPNLCVGCAGCIAICPVGAIRNNWSDLNFKEKIAEYAYGAQLNKDHIYINFLMNITEECDCMGQPMHLVAKNIGVFASKDPVAIDAACIDMLQEKEGTPLFDSGRVSIDHGVKIGLGSDQYELVEVE